MESVLNNLPRIVMFLVKLPTTPHGHVGHGAFVVGQILHTGQLSLLLRGLPCSSPHGHGAHVVGQALHVGHSFPFLRGREFS
jgi:hypothetical protein